MDRFCANEGDYHQRIIQNMDEFPDSLKSRQGLHVFVWGHETDLHDAGRGGGNGSADLFTVDEEGMVWLIECKFGQTSERGEFVWQNQLRRYKDAISRMEWQDLLSYIRKFLLSYEKVKPAFDVPTATTTFTRVIEIWQAQIGRSLMAPEKLNDLIATRLRNGTYGLMVLTDIRDPSYKESGKGMLHSGPLAYVLGTPCISGMQYQVLWNRNNGPRIPKNFTPTKIFTDKFVAPVRPPCTPEFFAGGLCNGSRRLWKKILEPGLIDLGARFLAPSRRGFEVHFDVGGASTPLLLIGWPEGDDKAVPRIEKLYGSAAARVDVHVKRIYQSFNNDIRLTNEIMKELYFLGWRGRPSKGMCDRWGVVDVELDELNSNIQGIMRYFPKVGTSCHTGRPGDEDSLRGLLRCIAKMLQRGGD